MEGNVASLRLAARLGFVPVDRLFVISRARTAEHAR
jgi:RimJ/RimL family protein N-acetyltransferase